MRHTHANARGLQPTTNAADGKRSGRTRRARRRRRRRGIRATDHNTVDGRDPLSPRAPRDVVQPALCTFGQAMLLPNPSRHRKRACVARRLRDARRRQARRGTAGRAEDKRRRAKARQWRRVLGERLRQTYLVAKLLWRGTERPRAIPIGRVSACGCTRAIGCERRTERAPPSESKAKLS